MTDQGIRNAGSAVWFDENLRFVKLYKLRLIESFYSTQKIGKNKPTCLGCRVAIDLEQLPKI